MTTCIGIRNTRPARRRASLTGLLAAMLVTGCASDGDYGGGGGGVSTSVSVGVGYGSYYGPGWYGGYYAPYPPVVVVPPENRPDRPDTPGARPTPLPSDGVSTMPATRPAPADLANRATTAPSRPATVDRPTSRPSARPAPRPMPRPMPRRR